MSDPIEARTGSSDENPLVQYAMHIHLSDMVRLRTLSAELGLPIQQLVREGMRGMLDRYDKKKRRKQNPGEK